jgi:hypothetical protein
MMVRLMMTMTQLHNSSNIVANEALKPCDPAFLFIAAPAIAFTISAGTFSILISPLLICASYSFDNAILKIANIFLISEKRVKHV